MSRASTYTLDHQWDAYDILGIQRDRRCVGWAPSMGRKCRNVVNWKDMDTFYGLVDDLSSHALDATRLQPHLRALAAVGLCKQVHRGTQMDSMVDTWTKKIREATVRRDYEELEVESYYSRTDTRSSTASFHTPATRRARSSTSTTTVRTSSTVQDEIDSTLRCLQAAREQERILVRRLAGLQTPNTSRTQRAIQNRTEAPSSHSDAHSVVSSRSLRSQRSSTSHRSTLSTLSSSSSDSSPPPAHHGATRVSPRSSAPAPPTPSQHHRLPPQTSNPARSTPTTTTSIPAPISTEAMTPLQQSFQLLWRDFLATQVSLGTTLPPELSTLAPPSPLFSTDTLHTTFPSTSTRSTPPPPPPCPTSHVRRLPIAEECPICYEAMSAEEALAWCKAGCGQSVHGDCMDAWKASLVAGGKVVRCTMCRGEWDEGCEC